MQSPGGGPRGAAPRSSSNPQYTVPNNAPKNHLLSTFLSACSIQIERKNSFKSKKIYVQGKYFNLKLSEHLEAHLMLTLKHGRHNEIISFKHNHYL